MLIKKSGNYCFSNLRIKHWETIDSVTSEIEEVIEIGLRSDSVLRGRGLGMGVT
jgi:hypothetical protein